VEDVTAKYTDIDSRIKSKKAIEKRYLNILDKATKVTEILQIERELGNIRIEIERMEANLKVLSSQSHFSTIELSIKKIYEKPEVKVIEKPSVFSQMASSLASGWGQAISFVLTLMRNWFAVLLVLGVGFTIRRFYRNKPDNENN
jgi:precorrin-6B methylase 1